MASHGGETTCAFPKPLLGHHRQFRNLNDTSVFHFNAEATSLTVDDTKLKCHVVVNESDQKARVIAQVDRECDETGFVCLEIESLSEAVLRLRRGRLSPDPDEACNENLFFDDKKTTLISKPFSPNKIRVICCIRIRRTHLQAQNTFEVGVPWSVATELPLPFPLLRRRARPPW